MKLDYIVVGLGLAGLAFIEELIAANKSFLVFEDRSQTSSLVAGGVYNPVILKRYSPVWNAKEQLAVALPFYERLEKKFDTSFDYKFAIKKAFKSIADQNNWFSAFDKPKVAPFLDATLDKQSYAGVLGNHSFGNVKEGGRIDTHHLVETYRNYLHEKDWIRFEKFNHEEIIFEKNLVRYQDLTASKIVFSEGFGLHQNPYFNHLPLDEVKGETITIHAPELEIDFLLKSTLFVMPIGNHLYKVGATFNHADKTSVPTPQGRDELIEKLKKVLDTPFKIVAQAAGIRPAVKDRRPMVGVHPQFSNLVVLNGLGTRGVMISPTIAKNLFRHLELREPLDPVIDIKRFDVK